MEIGNRIDGFNSALHWVVEVERECNEFGTSGREWIEGYLGGIEATGVITDSEFWAALDYLDE